MEKTETKKWYKKWWVWLIAIVLIGQVFKQNESNTASDNSTIVKSREAKFCSYCRKEINGSGVTGHYGELYCDKYCFVDGN